MNQIVCALVCLFVCACCVCMRESNNHRYIRTLCPISSEDVAAHLRTRTRTHSTLSRAHTHTHTLYLARAPAAHACTHTHTHTHLALGKDCEEPRVYPLDGDVAQQVHGEIDHRRHKHGRRLPQKPPERLCVGAEKRRGWVFAWVTERVRECSCARDGVNVHACACKIDHRRHKHGRRLP